MNHFFYALLLGTMYESITATNCNSVSKTIDSLLFLQGSQRCLWIGPTMYTNWTSAMNFCNSQNGYLAHIYNSDDQAKIMAWYNASSPMNPADFQKKTQNMYFGLLKDNNNAFTNGSQVHWVTSLTNKVADELKYFYYSFISSWGTSTTTSLILKYPALTFSFANAAAYPVCEQAGSQLHAFFSNWTGKYFGESQLVTQTTANLTVHYCAKQCAKKLQCMSFNHKVIGSSTSCELFDITKTDSGIPALVINSSHTYYKRNFI